MSVNARATVNHSYEGLAKAPVCPERIEKYWEWNTTLLVIPRRQMVWVWQIWVQLICLPAISLPFIKLKSGSWTDSYQVYRLGGRPANLSSRGFSGDFPSHGWYGRRGSTVTLFLGLILDLLGRGLNKLPKG